MYNIGNLDRDTLGIDPTGTYFNSRIQSKGIRTFGKPNMGPVLISDSNPGPGSYYFASGFPSFEK